MKDYKVYTNLETQNKITDFFLSLGYTPLYIEGVLNDTTIFEIDEIDRKKYKLGRVKLRKYLILGYEFRNGHSNDLYIHLTDNDEIFNEWLLIADEMEQDY